MLRQNITNIYYNSIKWVTDYITNTFYFPDSPLLQCILYNCCKRGRRVFNPCFVIVVSLAKNYGFFPKFIGAKKTEQMNITVVTSLLVRFRTSVIILPSETLLCIICNVLCFMVVINNQMKNRKFRFFIYLLHVRYHLYSLVL